MNTGLQKHTVEKKLRNRGINPDKIDLEAELDSSLTLTENIQNLENKYGKLERTGRDYKARMEGAQGRRRNSAKQYARSVHKKRPKYNRYVDQTKDAETTFADPTERQMEKWENNPNKYDIKGVDTRTGPERRPQTELPFQRRRNILYSGSRGDLKKSMRKIPASIRRNATGTKERVAKKVQDQGFEKLMSNREKLAVNQNALVSNFDIGSVIEEDRQRMKDKIAMTNFEREERMEAGSGYGKKLQADNGSRASEILKDSRNIGTVGKNLRGNTSERSDQQSLRDGFASKKSEKTLNKWKDNYI